MKLSKEYLENLLRSYYLEPISERINTIDPFVSSIKKSTNDVWGRDIVYTLSENDTYILLRQELGSEYVNIALDSSIIDKEMTITDQLNIINDAAVLSINKAENSISNYINNNGSKIVGFSDIFKEQGSIYGINNREKFPILVPRIEENFGKFFLEKLNNLMQELPTAPNLIITTYKIKKAIIDLINPDIIELYGGYKAIRWNDIPIITNKYCPENTMYILHTGDFSMHQLCDWQWLEDVNGNIVTYNKTENTYEATLVKYMNMLCTNISNQMMITGVEI